MTKKDPLDRGEGLIRDGAKFFGPRRTFVLVVILICVGTGGAALYYGIL